MTKFSVDWLYFTVINERKRTARLGDGSTTQNNAISGTVKENLVIPGSVSNQGITYTVIEIGRYAIYQQTGIKSIKISSNIEVIRDHGLFRVRYCESLIFEKNSKLTLIENFGLYDFYYLSTLEFNGNCLKFIGYSALRFMIYSMKNFTLPSSVKYIERNNIAGMTVLQHLYYCGDNQITGTEVFVSGNENYTVPSTLKIHTKSSYQYDYFAEKSVTRDADQYCQQQNFYCPLNKKEKCTNKPRTISFKSLLIMSFLIS